MPHRAIMEDELKPSKQGRSSPKMRKSTGDSKQDYSAPNRSLWCKVNCRVHTDDWSMLKEWPKIGIAAVKRQVVRITRSKVQSVGSVEIQLLCS